MNRLDTKVQEIKKKKRIGLMTHVVVGYPSLQETGALVQLMADSGVDIIELQIPFSDPIADGPTIMRACEIALRNGTRVLDAFSLVQKLRQSVSIPLFFMCYYNTVFCYGVEKFCEDAASLGIDGLIVPDMPLDEESYEHFYYFAQKYGLPVIQVISPVSTGERLKKIAKRAQKFVYAISHQGITGAKGELDKNVQQYLKKIREYISLPIAVGFGISKKEQVAALTNNADIAVVGSKIIDIISLSKDYKKEVGDFLRQLNMLK